MNAAVVRGFNAWAQRSFNRHTRWHRTGLLPLLYTFLWIATADITLSDELPPMRFEVLISQYGVTVWTVTALICPPLAMVGWWMIARCQCSAGPLIGLWIRLGAGLGECAVVLVYFVVSTHETQGVREDATVGHWITGAVLVYLANAVCRDGWSLVMVERLAYTIRSDD